MDAESSANGAHTLHLIDSKIVLIAVHCACRRSLSERKIDCKRPLGRFSLQGIATFVSGVFSRKAALTRELLMTSTALREMTSSSKQHLLKCLHALQPAPRSDQAHPNHHHQRRKPGLPLGNVQPKPYDPSGTPKMTGTSSSRTPSSPLRPYPSALQGQGDCPASSSARRTRRRGGSNACGRQGKSGLMER